MSPIKWLGEKVVFAVVAGLYGCVVKHLESTMGWRCEVGAYA